MRWQRVARVGVALAGLGTAVALYALSRERPVAERPEVTAIDPAALSQSGAGVEVRHELESERWRLEYGTQTIYPNDLVKWDQVHLRFSDGTEVWADHAEGQGVREGANRAASLTATGNVRLKTGEGATVEGQELRYSEQNEVTHMPGPVAFTKGRMSGSGTGATYERGPGVFRILADARLVTTGGDESAAGQPDAEQPASIVATADTLVFNKAASAMLFEGGARITRGEDVMTADRATLYLDENEERFRVIELRGNARVVPGSNADGAQQTPDMRAQDIDMSFYEGTEILERAVLSHQAALVIADAGGRRSIEGDTINLTTAPDGVTLTHLEAADQVVVRIPASADVPERRIESRTMIATGTEQAGGLTDALFRGNVRFAEAIVDARGQRTGERTGTAENLSLALEGRFDRIERAEFQQNVRFRDGSVEGEADLGTYEMGQTERLTLRPSPRGATHAPRVTDEDITVGATGSIVIALGSHDLHATGDVTTVSQGQQDAKADTPAARGALFGGSEKVFGFADEVWYDRAKQEIRYAGTASHAARLQQADSVVEGTGIVVRQDTNDLQATGAVRSTMPIEDAKKTGAGQQYRATAETMVYDDTARTITYEGRPVRLETPRGAVNAARVLLTLAREERRLERLEAWSDPAQAETAAVDSTLGEQQQSRSDWLLYEAALDRYRLRGRPFVLRTRDDDGTCSESTGTSGVFTPGEAAVIPEGEENPGGVFTRRRQSCTGPLGK